MAFASEDHLRRDPQAEQGYKDDGADEPSKEYGAYPELGKLQTWFREAEEAFWGHRKTCESVRDFVDGKQWTASEREALRKRQQAPVVFNRMRRKVDILNGIEKRRRQDPMAYPRTPQHDEDAELATDGIRYVCENNQFDGISSMVFDQACAVEGAAGCEIMVEFRPGEPDPEIRLNMLPFDRVFYDPHSWLPDYTDARYWGAVYWSDIEQARARYPWATDVIGQTITRENATYGDTYEDKPRYWFDRARNRIQIVKIWWRVGEELHFALFTGGGFVQEPRPSPYFDDKRRPLSDIELCSGYVTRQAERYGLAHIWVDPQMAINKRHSKALHLLSTRQSVSDPGVFNDIRKVKSELAKPDGHVQKDAEGEFGLLDTNDMATGNLALLQEAKDEIDATGPNSAEAMIGGPTGNVSGVALQADQNAGMLEVEPLFDHHRDWKLRVYRQIWARIRQFWRAPKWIRVTDDLRSMRWVGMNQPVTVGEMLMQQYGQDPQMAQMLRAQMQTDPRMQQVADMRNVPAEIDVDIIVDEGPDVVTTQAQEFQQILELVRIYGPQGVPIDQVIEASNMRSKERLLEAFRGNEEAQAAAAQRAAEEEQIARAGMVAELEDTQADIAKKLEDARLSAAKAAEIGAKLPADVDLTEAQTVKALADAGASEARTVVPFRP